MAWISQNWVWVLFAVGVIAMHLFGHGGHVDMVVTAMDGMPPNP
jgi:hypothetical protein